jgi:methylated-DNA-[protein]-cysteine S-methyltransferase
MKERFTRVGVLDYAERAPQRGARTPRSAPIRVEGPVYAARMRAPFAMLGIRTGQAGVVGIHYLPLHERALAPSDPLAERACRQLERYLADPQFRFTLPLVPGGTPFRQRVWQALSQIPIGESRTYGELARLLHSAPRAVGGACGANPIALVIPCHRVVGTHGSLGGFMGATEGDPIAIKRWLLAHEGYRFGA